MKKISNEFSWYPRSEWVWPDDDTQLLRVNDWVSDVNGIVQHVETFDVCVQAGGACGVWPARFAQFFSTVHTFEPHPRNFECLRVNVEPFANVFAYRCALSSSETSYGIALHEKNQHNVGAYYLTAGNSVRCVDLDSLQLNACDLIQLDVEGHENFVLTGALQTIRKYRPVIVLEESQMHHAPEGAHLMARGTLEGLGYRQVDKFHNDVVFKS